MRAMLAFAVGILWAVAAWAQAAEAAPETQRMQALQRAADAVVGLRALAVDDARSAATLGRARQGSGVVISEDGLVLTIGYLVLEAEQVQLLTDDDRIVPARVVAYDLATGFGLVKALVPLRLAPAPLGASAGVGREEPLMTVSGGEDGRASGARLVSRRGFSGYWEYHIDGALFTVPPMRNHSGAGLFNQRGELVGIGSLFVADTEGDGAPRQPGNMFVPVDLLQPVLPELLARGSSRQSTRAWIGINAVEHEGALRIVRVNDDSPADVAGLLAGDRIVRIDGQAVTALEQLWKTLWRQPDAERAVNLDVLRDGAAMSFVVQAVDRAKTLRRPRGI